MANPLREIAAVFSVEVDTKPLDGLAESVKSAKQALTQLSVSLAGGLAVRGLVGFVKSAVEAGTEIAFTATKLGVGTQELQEFNFAAGQVNVTTQEAAVAFKFLERNMGQAAEGTKKPLSYFQKTGIAFKDQAGKMRPVLDVIEDISDALTSPKWEGAKGTNLALQMFGRGGNALLPLLLQGRTAMHGMYEESEALGGIMGTQLLEAEVRVSQETKKLDFAYQGIRNRIMLQVLPIVERTVVSFTAMTVSMQSVVEHTDLVSVAAAGLGLGLVALLPTLAAFAIPAIAFAAIALSLADIHGWLEGEESVTGNWLKKMYGVKGANEILQDTKKIVADLKATFVDLGVSVPESLKAIGGILAVIHAGVLQVTSAVAGLGMAAAHIYAAFEKNPDGAGFVFNYGGLGDKLLQDLKVAGGPAAKQVANGLTEGDSAVDNLQGMTNLFQRQREHAGIDESYMAVNGGWVPREQTRRYNEGSFTGPVNVSSENPINVNITLQANATKEDAQRVAQEAVQAIDMHFKNAAHAVGGGY